MGYGESHPDKPVTKTAEFGYYSLNNVDNLVKSQKSSLFTRVFCIWCLVFSILTFLYSIIYFIPNTKHLMNSTFYEFIKVI